MLVVLFHSYLEVLNNFGTWNQLLSRNLDRVTRAVSTVSVLVVTTLSAVVLWTPSVTLDVVAEHSGSPIVVVSARNSEFSDLTVDGWEWVSVGLQWSSLAAMTVCW